MHTCSIYDLDSWKTCKACSVEAWELSENRDYENEIEHPVDGAFAQRRERIREITEFRNKENDRDSSRET